MMTSAPRLGVKSIALVGDGENTLNPHLYEALEAGCNAGLDIGLGTNGILLDSEEKLHTVLSTCTWLRFNLSAVGEEGYNSIHGVPKWEQVQANIGQATYLKYAKGYNCTIGLQMVLTPASMPHIIPMAQFALDSGVDYMVIKQFSDPDCSEMSQFNLDWYDNPELMELLRTAEGMSTEDTQIVPKWKIMQLKGKRDYDHCVDCPLIFQMSGDGKCYPCGYLFNSEEHCYGDLTKQTFEEIIKGERYWDVVKHMRKEFDVHTECKGCCRHDSTNSFIWNYLSKPDHINFI